MDMEQEDRERLIRIDERTASIADLFERHVGENRDDFRDVHHRVNKVVAKQNWIVGVGTSFGAILGVVAVWLKNTFAGGA